jgi:hypothetical protein
VERRGSLHPLKGSAPAMGRFSFPARAAANSFPRPATIIMDSATRGCGIHPADVIAGHSGLTARASHWYRASYNRIDNGFDQDEYATKRGCREPGKVRAGASAAAEWTWEPRTERPAPSRLRRMGHR